MSSEDFERVRHRQRQARYEARQRAGVALYSVPLGALEIDALVALGWLREGNTANSIEEMHEAVKLTLVGNQLWPLLYPRRICPRMNGSGSRPMILLPETTSVG